MHTTKFVSKMIFYIYKVSILKKPMPVNFKTLYNDKEFEYKDVQYTPHLKRPITIIDPETTDGSAYIYPLTKVFTVGLNFRF